MGTLNLLDVTTVETLVGDIQTTKVHVHATIAVAAGGGRGEAL